MGALAFSSVRDLFGGSDNNAGTTAQAAPLIQPVTQEQTNSAQSLARNALGQQQNFADSLQGQGAQGINTQSALTQALINQANGQGPNPAQAALNQATGQNISNQAALAAGQRGASGNVGLMARQIGQQGAGIQQNAIGQSAVLQAQQQLAAQQQLQNLAAAQIGQQGGAIGNLNAAAQGNQGQLLNALQGYNNAQVGSTSSQNSANAGIAEQNAKNTAGTIGGLANGLAGAAELGAFAAKGGEIESDGSLNHGKQILSQALSKKKFPDHIKEVAQIYHPDLIKNMACGGMAEGAEVPGEPKISGKNTVKNDVVPAMLTPKEIVLPLSVTQAKNPGEAAKAFVEHIKGKDSSDDKDGDFKKALKEHVAKRKNKKA